MRFSILVDQLGFFFIDPYFFSVNIYISPSRKPAASRQISNGSFTSRVDWLQAILES